MTKQRRGDGFPCAGTSGSHGVEVGPCRVCWARVQGLCRMVGGGRIRKVVWRLRMKVLHWMMQSEGVCAPPRPHWGVVLGLRREWKNGGRVRGKHRASGLPGPGVVGPLQKVRPCCPALTQPLCPASVNPSLVKVHIHHPPEASVQVHQVARVRGEAPEENSVETRPSPRLPASPRHSHWDGNSIPARSGEAPQPPPPAAPRPPGRLGRCYLSSVNGQVRRPLPQP